MVDKTDFRWYHLHVLMVRGQLRLQAKPQIFNLKFVSLIVSVRVSFVIISLAFSETSRIFS